MIKKILSFLGLALCLVACGDDGLSPEEIKEQEFREGIVGTWVYNHPEIGAWEEWICTSSGKIYVSYITGFNMEEIQLEKKSGNYTITGEKLSAVLDGSTNDYVLSSVNEYEMTCVSVVLGRTFTYSRQYDEVTLNRGETMVIDSDNLVSANQNIYSLKSHNPTIATVDSSGKVTAEEPGYTYIDVVTGSGTCVLRVNVKDGNNLFPDYSDALAMNTQQVKERWGNDFYYEKADGIAYLINNDYVTNVLFFTDENKDVNLIWLLLNKVQTEKEARKNAIHTCLSTQYTYLGTSEEGIMTYCNFFGEDNLPFYIHYSPDEETVAYVKASLDLWRDYSLDFGKTASQLKSEYGEPAMVDEGGSLYYWETNDYVSYRAYVLNETTQKVSQVYAMLKEGFDGQAVLDELQRKYIYYEKGSDPSVDFFAFKNEEETVGVIYNYPESYLAYVDLTVVASRNANGWCPSAKEYIHKVGTLHKK